jgi:hypothetical protein
MMSCAVVLALVLERAVWTRMKIGDQTTSQRLWGFMEELRQKLQRRLAARRLKQQIRARAHELWEQHGRPAGRDVEFWLQAEEEVIGAGLCRRTDSTSEPF